MKTKTTHIRVIPRDLFNEAKLLKCMGQLSLMIHDGVRWPLRLELDDSESAGFIIVQSQDDGNLSVENLALTIGESRIEVCTPYNCKDAYPLRFSCGDYSGDVFTYDGVQFHSDFILFLNAQTT